jgi:hypothetical protein
MFIFQPHHQSLLRRRTPFASHFVRSFSLSILEARRIMQIPDGVVYPSKQFTEDHLKKQYLKLAKVYHPDA